MQIFRLIVAYRLPEPESYIFKNKNGVDLIPANSQLFVLERNLSSVDFREYKLSKYVNSMARYYKYSFDNNVLIYTQRPDASLLATFDVWNSDKIDRRVNKGAKSIAVIDLSNPKASLKYLFDLMDTNGSHESFRQVMGFMWELEEQYRPGIIVD